MNAQMIQNRLAQIPHTEKRPGSAIDTAAKELLNYTQRSRSQKMRNRLVHGDMKKKDRERFGANMRRAASAKRANLFKTEKRIKIIKAAKNAKLAEAAIEKEQKTQQAATVNSLLKQQKKNQTTTMAATLARGADENRQRVETMQKKERNALNARAKATTKIQAVWRGGRNRKKVKNLRKAKANARAAASLRRRGLSGPSRPRRPIGPEPKGFVKPTRKTFKTQDGKVWNESKVYTRNNQGRLKQVFGERELTRGNNTLKYSTSQLRNNNAATHIQKFARGARARRHVRERKKRNAQRAGMGNFAKRNPP